VTRVFVVCGSGGVGKTTTAAALGVKLAREGTSTLVLTIDPARRLADALGLGPLSREPTPVPGVPGLHALAIDAKATFDEIVERHAPSPAVATRILSNHYYGLVSSRLGGAHEYMAMEKLYAIAASGRFDALVLDTPPSLHALDFLRAPERMAALMDDGVLRWIVLPRGEGGWRMIEMGSEVLAAALRQLLGPRTIGDIADFFGAFAEMWSGFRERSLGARELLRVPGTRFYLVTSPAPASRAEALAFLDALQGMGIHLGGIVVNRCVAAGPASCALGPAPSGVDAARWDALGWALADVVARRQTWVESQDRAIREIAAQAPKGAPTWRVPDRPGAVQDVEGLAAIGEWLPG
jgi:anion-transporting  ArsA/GET3 family ATPase